MVELKQPAEVGTTRQATEQAWHRHAIPHVLDCTELVNKRSVLCAIAAELSFPEWACCDFETLYDCLTDLSWLEEGEHVLIWSGWQALAERNPKAYQALASVLLEASEDDAADYDGTSHGDSDGGSDAPYRKLTAVRATD